MANMHNMHMDRLDLLNSIVCKSRSSKVILEVTKGHFGVKNRKYGQMDMICISIDSDFNTVHLEVIRGDLRGQKMSF